MDLTGTFRSSFLQFFSVHFLERDVFPCRVHRFYISPDRIPLDKARTTWIYSIITPPQCCACFAVLVSTMRNRTNVVVFSRRSFQHVLFCCFPYRFVCHFIFPCTTCKVVFGSDLHIVAATIAKIITAIGYGVYYRVNVK